MGSVGIGESDMELMTAQPKGNVEEVQGNMKVNGALSAASLNVAGTIKANAISSSAFTQDAAGGAQEVYMLSALYCFWNGERFTRCPNERTSWGGVANFAVNDAANSGDNGLTLRIPFSNAYTRRPVCSVSFRDVAALVKTKATGRYLEIAVSAEGGCPQPWAKVETWLTIVCHGTRELI